MSDVSEAPRAALAKLLPFYLVIDVSYSMDGPKLDQCNKIMGEVVDMLAEHTILSDKVRFALIDFSDDARVQLPLCDPGDPDIVVPGLSPRGSTSYASAFRLLKTQIQADFAQLKADNYSVGRPAVYFLTDGEPNPGDGWEQAFADLTEYDKETKTGFAMYPNVIPFGVDDADPQTLRQLIHPKTGTKAMKMFLAAEGQGGGAIASMVEVLLSSVLASGQSAAKGGPPTVLPDDDDLPDGVVGAGFDDEDYF